MDFQNQSQTCGAERGWENENGKWNLSTVCRSLNNLSSNGMGWDGMTSKQNENKTLIVDRVYLCKMLNLRFVCHCSCIKSVCCTFFTWALGYLVYQSILYGSIVIQEICGIWISSWVRFMPCTVSCRLSWAFVSTIYLKARKYIRQVPFTYPVHWCFVNNNITVVCPQILSYFSFIEACTHDKY